jgi:signal transduction histidine kinase
MLIYGWVLEINGPLAAALVLLFFFSLCATVSFNVISTLLIDFYPKAPATATAASNLMRCLLGAGATGVITPMIDAMGRGWCFTFLSLFLAASSPLLWVVYFRGMGWREKRRLKREKKDNRQEEKEKKEKKKKKVGSKEGGRAGESEKRTAPPIEGGELEAQAVVEEEREKQEEEGTIKHKISPVFSHKSAF